MGTFNTTVFNAGAPAGPGGASFSAGSLFDAILTPAFRIAGLLQRPGQKISANEAAEGLQVVNDWLDWLKLDRLAVYAIQRALFGLTPGKGDYTIGLDPSGQVISDIPDERPIRIDRASFIFTNVTPNIEVPLQVLNEQEWQALSPKSLTASTPTKLFYESLYPQGVLHFWAVPTVAYQMALYLWRSVNQYLTVDDPVQVAPGYRITMQYNLAQQLAERYPDRQRMAPSSTARAVSTLAALKRANAPRLLMQCESGALGLDYRGQYNIYSNSYSSGSK
jgi:hypothetical protein